MGRGVTHGIKWTVGVRVQEFLSGAFLGYQEIEVVVVR